MRVLSRGWLLVLISVVATLVVPVPAAAAVDDVLLLAEAGPSGTPMYLQPLVETAAGMVFRNSHDSTTWIDPAGAGDAQREDRLPDPTVVGDLLSSYDAGTTTLRWRTIADATLQEAVLAPESTFLARTATGYLVEQGAGPYDLVAVDLLAGGASTVIGTAGQLDGVIAGPLGAAAPDPDVPGGWRYYPYDGTAPAGGPVQSPVGAGTCQLTSAHLYCWSATQLTRLPLDGAPGTTINQSPLSLVETGAGVAYTIPAPDLVLSGSTWRQVMAWRSDQSAGLAAVNGFQHLTGPLAPVIGGTDLALAAKNGTAAEAGIYRISSAYAVTRVRSAEVLPYRASAIALGPGRVAWHDNSHEEGAVASRPLGKNSSGELSMGSTSSMATRTNANGLSVNGHTVAYWSKERAGLGIRTLGSTSYPVPALEVISSTVSGQRMLSRTRDSNGVLQWKLTTLHNSTATLPDAVSYDLWGQRLAWVDPDGSVWLRDLRTEAAAVQVAPGLSGGVTAGVVQVAGDVVAWDLTPTDDAVTDPGVLVRDVATMAATDAVIGLSELHDLSTGYAVGHGCSQDEGCTPRAVALADGTVIPIETERRLAVDGDLLGFITMQGLPAVRALPAYDDDPRLLDAFRAADEVDFSQYQAPMRLAASRPLTSCALELRDAEGTLVRTNQCTAIAYGVATVTWNDTGRVEDRVPLGTYSWRIVAASGDRPLVDYDGSTSALSGTVTVTGPPVPEPEPEPVPMPDLGFAHQRPDGGLNLFRMALSELEVGAGVARAVRSLPVTSGFRAAQSKVVAGDFGNLTPGDVGTADHVIWHAGSDGGVRMFTVAGSTDTAPRLQHVLRKSAGWSWADSRPLAGDLNGDGWDDVLVVHRGRATNLVWAFISDGTRLGPPQRWGSVPGDFGSMRNYVADADGDWNEDLITTAPASGSFRTTTLLTRPDGTGARAAADSHVATFRAADGWSLAYSRQMAGDVTADGLVDLVTVHRSGSGGLVVWVSASCSAADGDVCWEAPVKWQTLGSGWSFANSRQYLADTDGDYVDDLISVHRSGAGGIYVWRHLSDHTVLRAPQQIAALPTSAGWNWSLSRESVANTWG